MACRLRRLCLHYYKVLIKCLIATLAVLSVPFSPFPLDVLVQTATVSHLPSSSTTNSLTIGPGHTLVPSLVSSRTEAKSKSSSSVRNGKVQSSSGWVRGLPGTRDQLWMPLPSTPGPLQNTTYAMRLDPSILRPNGRCVHGLNSRSHTRTCRQ